MNNENFEFKKGVYFKPNKSFVKFAIVEAYNDKYYEWTIDLGQTKKHPLFRGLTISYRQRGSGEYFFNRTLRGFEYLGEL